jgi:ATP-dependent protease Clp ATPase subunit
MNPDKCSFCGRKRTDVEILIAGKNANICDDCVGTCVKGIVKAIQAGGGGCAGCTRETLQEALAALPVLPLAHVH